MKLPLVPQEKVDAITLYSNNLKVTLLHNATAYGYSILITGTYIILANTEGGATTPDVFLGAFGAILSFALIEAISTRGFQERGKGDKPEVVMLGSAMSFFSVGFGLGSAVLCGALLSGWVDWLVAPLVATTVYILIETIELMMAKRLKNEEQA